MGCDVEFVDVTVGRDEVDVLAVVGPEVSTEGAGTRGSDAVAGEFVEIVVDPAAVREDVELVDVAVGANEVDVLTAVGTDVAIEGAVSAVADSAAGEDREVVVDPTPIGPNKEFVNVVVGANEVDVLSVVVVDVAAERSAGSRKNGFGETGEIVVDPLGAALRNVELVDVIVGTDVVDMLATGRSG